MKVKSIDHLVLTVKNIDLSVRFYESVLGMQKVVFKGNHVALKFGNQKINLHELGKEFEPKAQEVSAGSADLCFVLEGELSDAIRLHFKF